MELGETGRMVVALVETGAFCIIALGSLCEINNWWERRRSARRDRRVKSNVQKSAANLVNYSNDDVTQFLQHAWIDDHAPGTFHVVGTVNLDTLTIAPQLAVIDRVTGKPNVLVTLTPTADSFRRDLKAAVEASAAVHESASDT
jgi:hypothetical protein